MTREDIARQTAQIVAEHLKAPLEKVTSNTHFADLGADSLDHVEIVMALEERFNVEITDADALTVARLSDAVDLIVRLLA